MIFIGTLGRQSVREVRLDNDRLNLTDGRTLVFKPETVQKANFTANTPTIYRGDWREPHKLLTECVCDTAEGRTTWLYCNYYERCYEDDPCQFDGRCPAHAEDVK